MHVKTTYFMALVASPGAVTDGVTLFRPTSPFLVIVLKRDDLFYSLSYTLPSPLPSSPPFQVIVCPLFL